MRTGPGRRGRGHFKAQGLAKISAPHLPMVATRKRLFERLDRAASRGIVWIDGPPGSGKTTLAAQYVRLRKFKSLWYQIDVTDMDVGTFFHFLGLAVDHASARRGNPLPRFSPESLLGLSGFSRSFFRAAFARLTLPFVIVFDNCHEVPADARLHEAFAAGIDELPEGGSLLFLSRSDPPPPLTLFEAAQRLKRVGYQQLRFTREEVSAITRMHLGNILSKERIGTLHAVTQGWAAGLILAVEHLKGQGEVVMPPEGSVDVHDASFNFFAGEIFDRLDRETQEFLLKAAVLHPMTPNAVEQLTGKRDASRRLAELNRRNYFVLKHDHVASFEFHPLFRSFLLHRAQSRFSISKMIRLQEKAAGFLEEEGQIDEAVRLLCDARDWAGAARLILTHTPARMGQGRGGTVAQWLAGLPEAEIAGNPWLLYWRGIIQLFANPTEGLASFQKAFELFQSQSDRIGTALACSGMIDAILFEMANPGQLDRWISILDECVNNSPGFPDAEIEARILSSLFRALMIRRPDHPQIDQAAARLLSRTPSTRDPNLRALMELDVAFHDLFCGRINKAFTLIEQVRLRSNPERASPMARITLCAVEAWNAMLTAAHPACLRAVEEGLRIAEETGVLIWSSQMMSNAAASAISAGDLSDAGAWLVKAERWLGGQSSIPKEFQRLDVAYLRCVAAWGAMAQDDKMLALRHQTTALEIAKELGMPFVWSLSHLGMAQILFALARPENPEALAHLHEAGRIADSMRSEILTFACLLTDAFFSFEQGREADGLDRLRKALALGRKHGFLNCYWWRSRVVADLCVKALNADIETPYVQELIQKRDLVPDHPPLECERWPWRVKIFTLGRFELVMNGRPLRFTGKCPRKPLDLLNALIALGGRDVAEFQLTDTLWPESGGDAAHDTFKMTLHLLRKLLNDKNGEVLRFSNGRLTLNAGHCWVDAWLCEQLLNKAKTNLDQKKEEQALRLFEKARALYQGPFLQGEEDQSCILSTRDRLDQKFRKCAERLGKHFQ